MSCSQLKVINEVTIHPSIHIKSLRDENRREQKVSNSWGSREGVEVDFGNKFRHSSAQFHNKREVQFRYAVARGKSKLPECKYRRNIPV
jgi:hypothetical protein